MTGCAKPFFGFEICDLRTFLGLKFCSDFFWVRDFGKDLFGVDKKRNSGFSFLCQTIVSGDAKTVWNSLELLLLVLF